MQRSFHALLKICETKGLFSCIACQTDLHGQFRLTNYHYLRLNLAKTLRSTISHLWRESWDLQQYLCLGFTSHVSFRGRHHFIPTDTAAIEDTLPRVPVAGHGRGGICAPWELDCGGRAWILTRMAVLIKRKVKGQFCQWNWTLVTIACFHLKEGLRWRLIQWCRIQPCWQNCACTNCVRCTSTKFTDCFLCRTL